MERYYNLAGDTVLEQYFVPDTTGKPLASRIILKNYAGVAERFFQNTDDLFTYFIRELSRLDDQAVFISDRPGTGVQPLLSLAARVPKFVTVPIYHAKDINDPLHAPLDAFLQPAFDNLNHFTGFITSSETQKQQLQTRFPQAKVVTIPATTTTPLAQSRLRPMSKRPKQLLYVGRLAADRQIDQLIRVVALVKAQIPNIKLDLYGYGAPDYVKTVTDLIAELKLQANVQLCDYQPDLERHYDDYQLLLNTALADGGPMAMPEAMAHGIPVISYRFNYGPADVIEEGEDGFVVDQGDQLTMSADIVALLQDQDRLNKFSQEAYAKLHVTQTNLKVWHQWQHLLAMGD